MDKGRLRTRVAFFAGFVGACLALPWHSAADITITQTQTIAAGAFVGGTPSQQGGLGRTIRINHQELAAISAVTKEVIIQGEAGEAPRNFVPNFKNRITPQSPRPQSPSLSPLAAGNIRVTVFYRFAQAGSPPDQNDLGQSQSVLGPDPFGFAFQVPPSSLDNGILQYRILAERLEDQGGFLVTIASATYPISTPSNLLPWVSVGIIAHAAPNVDASGGRIVLSNGNPNVGQTELNIPAGALSGPTTVTLDELPTTSPLIPNLSGLGQPVAVYKLDADRSVNSVMQFTILYPDFVFPTGQQGTITGTNQPENRASVAWWDGFAWRRLGGTQNPDANTITTHIKFFSFMAVVPAPTLAPEDRRPLERVITPNGDGKNDSVFFALDGGRVEIFDITGRRVRTLSGATNPEWDGRDDGGKIVESGVYIYQYEADGKRVSGLIAVAK